MKQTIRRVAVYWFLLWRRQHFFSFLLKNYALLKHLASYSQTSITLFQRTLSHAKISSNINYFLILVFLFSILLFMHFLLLLLLLIAMFYMVFSPWYHCCCCGSGGFWYFDSPGWRGDFSPPKGFLGVPVQNFPSKSRPIQGGAYIMPYFQGVAPVLNWKTLASAF